MVLKEKLGTFNFVLLLVIQYEVLDFLNIVSKSLQSETVDQLFSHELWGSALLKLIEMRGRFGELVSEASDICKRWGMFQSYRKSRIRKVKKHSDELCEDKRLQNPESSFRITLFYPMADTLCIKLENRFQGMKDILGAYQVIQPGFLVKVSEKYVHDKALDFVRNFPFNVSPTFSSQICSVKDSLKDKLEKMIGVEFAVLLIVDHSSLSESYSDVCTVCIMYLAISIAVVMAKLNIGQERLSKLALLLVENDSAQQINCDQVTNDFA
ncbi:hypothetical protein PR048_005866, partial [Dryococelus australis]